MAGFVFLFFVAGVAIIPLILKGIRAHRDRINAAWGGAASELGLSFQPSKTFGSPRIYGTLDEQAVSVDTFTRSSGNNNSTTYTRYQISYPESLGLGLKLTKQGFLSGVGKFFGSQDIEIGNAGFDDGVMVKGSDPQVIRAFLTPSRQMRAQRCLESFRGSQIHDTGIYWEMVGVVREQAVLVSHIEGLVSVALHMGDSQKYDQQLNQAIESQHNGDLDEAIKLVQSVPAADRGRDADAQLLEGELLITLGRHDEARPSLDKVAAARPDDEDAKNWAELARREPPPIPVTPPPVPPLAAAPTPASGSTSEVVAPPSAPVSVEQVAVAVPSLDAKSVGEALFHPDVRSAETRRIFEDNYNGREVSWTGELRRASSYSYDTIFGTGDGTKAVFLIHTVDGGVYGGRQVQAVVQLPPEANQALSGRTGKSVTFKGTLVSCDSLMRNLFVKNGVLS